MNKEFVITLNGNIAEYVETMANQRCETIERYLGYIIEVYVIENQLRKRQEAQEVYWENCLNEDADSKI